VSYQPLARKYRPQNFDDLVGQDTVSTALANGIKLGREPSAVIFSGVRGIGKTTLARLYAKALNCDDGPTANPCGSCESCEAIAKGHHEDVLEIDGASNTSVEDVRALRETISYAPQRSKFKVYIIDEVHMLSNSAFNALLKTLEEPPKHVVFLFATTELEKIPQTIVGRCQTFYLKKFNLKQIIKRLKDILDIEQVPYDDRAIMEIAKRGKGSMRDALTLLDTAIAVSSGELDMNRLSSLLSSVSTETYLELLDSLVEKNAAKIAQIIEDLNAAGVDFIDTCEELARMSRHGFVLRDIGQSHLESLTSGMSDSEVQQLKDICQKAQPFVLNRLFRTLMHCRGELDHSELDQFVFENYCFEWCLDPGLMFVDDPNQAKQTETKPYSRPTQNSVNSAPLEKLAPALATASVHGDELSGPEKAASPSPRPHKNMLAELRNQPTPQVLPEKQPQAPGSDDLSPALSPNEPSNNQDKDLESGQHLPSDEDEDKKPFSNMDMEPQHDDPLAEVQENGSARRSAEVLREPPDETTNPAPLPLEDGVNDDSEQSQTFPSSWRDLVECWQQQKPLQARVFQETYQVSFSPEEIIIAVNPETMAGKKLLTKEIQSKTSEMMRLMFNFVGRFEVINRAEVVEQDEHFDHLDQSESILETKQREKSKLIEKIELELRDHPITKDAVKHFKGEIISVEVNPNFE
jgi:DNA polymerase III subunit gamma/tau